MAWNLNIQWALRALHLQSGVCVLHSVIVSMDYNAQCAYSNVLRFAVATSVYLSFDRLLWIPIFSNVCDIVLVGLLSLLLRSVGDAVITFCIYRTRASTRLFHGSLLIYLPNRRHWLGECIRFDSKTKQDKWRGINKDRTLAFAYLCLRCCLHRCTCCRCDGEHRKHCDSQHVFSVHHFRFVCSGNYSYNRTKTK